MTQIGKKRRSGPLVPLVLPTESKGVGAGASVPLLVPPRVNGSGLKDDVGFCLSPQNIVALTDRD
jgi:hypothetical protein